MAVAGPSPLETVSPEERLAWEQEALAEVGPRHSQWGKKAKKIWTEALTYPQMSALRSPCLGMGVLEEEARPEGEMRHKEPGGL